MSAADPLAQAVVSAAVTQGAQQAAATVRRTALRQALRPPGGPLLERDVVTVTVELEVIAGEARGYAVAEGIPHPGRLAAAAVGRARADREEAGDGLVLGLPREPAEIRGPVPAPLGRDVIRALLDDALARPGGVGTGGAGGELTDELVQTSACWHSGQQLAWTAARRRLWTWLDGPGGDLLEGDLTWGDELPGPAGVRARSTELASLRLRAVSFPGEATMPVLVAPGVATHLVNAFCGVFSGASGNGLAARIGRRIASRATGLTDDARPGQGPWGTPVDAEGTGTRRVALIEHGVLTGLLHTAATGRAAGAAAGGQAVRRRPDLPVRPGPTGFWLEPGTAGVAALRGTVEEGFEAAVLVRAPWVDERGTWHAEVIGWPLRRGERSGAPRRAEISAGVLRVLRHLVACGSALLHSTTFRGVAAPALLTDNVLVRTAP